MSEYAGMEIAHVFILRIWHEPREIAGALPLWRCTIEHVPSGKRRVLKAPQEIIEFIATYDQDENRSLEALLRLRRYTVMVQIENLTGRPVTLSLNSGTALHLPPRQISEQILEVEVQSNAKVEKLSEQRIIAVRPIDEGAAAGAAEPPEDQGEPPTEESRARSRRRSPES